ncbi:MAG: NAD(P)H-dependent glycerol-3-phosphate dehydrogenase [Pseudomonadota bacterium]
MTGRIAIAGAGAWGTALALACHRGGHAVTLWAHADATRADIATNRENTRYLPGHDIPAAIRVTGVLGAVADADVVLVATPAQHVRAACQGFAPHHSSDAPVVICAKGIEQATSRRLSEIAAEELPGANIAILSGPGFAADVARGRPVALTLAGADSSAAETVARDLATADMRLYWTDDIIGVELGGALKNVIAIAAGIVDGLDLGCSAHAGMVTRGFAEMRRLAEAVGARPETLGGLSGLGDLILTCGSTQSRNMSLGRAIGGGRAARDVLAERSSVAEGVFTTEAALRLAARHGVDMPITQAVSDIVTGATNVRDGVAALLDRPLKPED